MKTTNFGFRSPSTLLLVVYCLAFLFILAGCKEYTLWTFSGLEKKALENGTVSAGAARVTDYNNSVLEESRKRLVQDLNNLRVKFATDMNLVPQAYIESLNVQHMAASAIISASLKDSNASLVAQDPCNYFGKLSEAFYKIIDKTQGPRPSDIELVGLRMATLKFIDSEIEDINNLDSVCHATSDYRRVVISLDLTAWVSGKAKAALVYVDLYPYKADIWCHEAGDVLRDINKPEGAKYYEPDKAKWNEKLRILAAFNINDIEEVNLPRIYEDDLRGCEKKRIGEVNIYDKDKSCDYIDYIAECHRWLSQQNLLPRIVQVERMSPGEYSILAQGDYSGTELQVKASSPAGVSGIIQFILGKKSEELTARVRPLNLAFVAGERRTGWLFMPVKSEQNRMRPTERRLRMVVDIPKNMTKLGIYVHKAFLDSDLHIVSDTDFASQMKNLEDTREKLTESDSFYEQYKKERAFYGLVKTRIRNLFYQGWSEEMVVDTCKPK